MMLVYEAGVYHGDLHAGNVIINEDKPHIIDFGTSLFSGVTASNKRDCEELVKLCFEVLPELHKLEFIDNAVVIEQDSKIAAEYLLRCLQIIWNFENSYTFDLDRYTYKERKIRFDVLLEDFSFLDRDAVNKFFAEKYSRKART
jgi:predicted unusual protein kinase regulating ubiquinone biosynthesis (AarF/ABC1/UbiB family)